jgi:hypothetical protein
VREAGGISTRKKSKAQKVIVTNAAEVLETLTTKGSLSLDIAVAKKAVLASLVSSQTVEKKFQRATASVLKLRRGSVKKGAERRVTV